MSGRLAILVVLMLVRAGFCEPGGAETASAPASRPSRPLVGPGVIIDPSFAYYHDRSLDSIAAEIRANGYQVVHVIAEPAGHVDRKLVAALHGTGIGVWYQAFGNGTYSRDALPAGWERWRMVTRTDLVGGKLPGSFQRLCLNNPGYRAWKKRDLAAALHAAPFDGIEIAESHWPEYPGVDSPAYACFCDSCRQAFGRMFPGERELPDVIHADSPRAPARNPQLWAKWLQFRQASLTAFLDDIVNGKGGIRQTSPRVKVCVWGLGLSGPDAVRRMREDSGQDAGEVVVKVKPDVYCIQTHWPDWMRKDLPPDYVKQYQPFIDQVRKVAPKLPLMVQTDIGSTRDAIRDRKWIEAFEADCRSLGVQSTVLYEYFIGGWTYDEPPRVTQAVRRGNSIKLTFTRRLDPASVRKPGAIGVSVGRIRDVSVDGNIVSVQTTGPVPPGTAVILTGIQADAGRRLFPDYRPIASARSQRVTVR